MPKITDSAKIESNNLLEEAAEIFDSCISCGMCKSFCPVFKALREERVSARGKGDLLHEKIMDKVLFECTLCGACEGACPVDVKVCDAVRKGREAMVLKGKGMKLDGEAVDNIKEFGNIFGKV